MTDADDSAVRWKISIRNGAEWTPGSREDDWTFFGQMGTIDAYAPEFDNPALIVVCSTDDAERRGRNHNYTLLNYLDGRVVAEDKDVDPTPYEMCLIYAHFKGTRDV